MIKFVGLILITMMVGCSNGQPTEANSSSGSIPTDQELPELLRQALEAHGGLTQWNALGRLEYDLYQNGSPVDHQLVDPQSRKVRIESDAYTLGFDGQQIWVSPDTSAFTGSSPRFYHNLQFYFFALPFVFADPGIQYEVLEPRDFQGTTYERLKITYQSDVGDAPDDVYIAHFDPESHQLRLLLYTVTYFSQSPGDSYNARVYDTWQSVNGLLVPEQVVSYRWENDSLGEPRGTTEYRNVVLGNTALDQENFAMPEEATVSER